MQAHVKVTARSLDSLILGLEEAKSKIEQGFITGWDQSDTEDYEFVVFEEGGSADYSAGEVESGMDDLYLNEKEVQGVLDTWSKEEDYADLDNVRDNPDFLESVVDKLTKKGIEIEYSTDSSENKTFIISGYIEGENKGFRTLILNAPSKEDAISYFANKLAYQYRGIVSDMVLKYGIKEADFIPGKIICIEETKTSVALEEDGAIELL